MRRRRSVASFAFAALSALVAAACNQLLGSENAGSVVPDDAGVGAGRDASGDGGGADSASLGNDAGSFDARAPDGGCVTPYTNCADGGALADCHDLASDAKSCGACGNACVGVCASGACTGTEVAKVTDPRALVADATHGVWFTTGNPGTVSRLDTTGAVVVAVSNATDAFGVALDPANGDVFYTQPSQRVVAKVGGAALAVDKSGSHVGSPQLLAIEGSYVVFTDPTNRTVWSQLTNGTNNLAGSTPGSGGTPYAIATAGGVAYFTTPGGCAGTADGTVQSITVPAGSGPTTVAPGLACPKALAVDAANVYVAEHGLAGTPSSGKIEKVARGGGAPSPVATGQAQPDAIVVSGADVYWTNAGDAAGEGSVVHATTSGGAPQVLASKQATPLAVAIAGKKLYWLVAGAGTAPQGALLEIDLP